MDRRSARIPIRRHGTPTAHGAYLELATLALLRQRLLKERQAALSRGRAIERRVAEMERRAEELLEYVESVSPDDSEGMERKGRGVEVMEY